MCLVNSLQLSWSKDGKSVCWSGDGSHGGSSKTEGKDGMVSEKLKESVRCERRIEVCATN